jgi:hypothetical protein
MTQSVEQIAAAWALKGLLDQLEVALVYRWSDAANRVRSTC